MVCPHKCLRVNSDQMAMVIPCVEQRSSSRIAQGHTRRGLPPHLMLDLLFLIYVVIIDKFCELWMLNILSLLHVLISYIGLFDYY